MLCCVFGGVACSLSQESVGLGVPQVVVHLVLNPGYCVQTALVEQTLTGETTVPGQRLRTTDPVRTGGGIPIVGAQVTITAADGTRLIATSVANTTALAGAGLYTATDSRCTTAPFIRPGQRYDLRVTTPKGEIVTGTTTVPSDRPVPLDSTLVPFDRDRDTARVTWPVSPDTRVYGVRVETPFGPSVVFTDSSHIALPGSLRNLNASNLERVFIPGFRQEVTVIAADSNYFDYYRTRNDPFTGSGIINRLQGGIGLFGSVVLVRARMLDVSQGVREPEFEGEYTVTQTPSTTTRIADLARLYVETSGEPAVLSGWYSAASKPGVKAGIDGERLNGRVTLRLLVDQNSRESASTFTGTVLGDSIVGSYSNVAGARVVFRRKR